MTFVTEGDRPDPVALEPQVHVASNWGGHFVIATHFTTEEVLNGPVA